MSNSAKCFVCDREAKVQSSGTMDDFFIVTCSFCGNFSITEDATWSLSEDRDVIQNKVKISVFIRERTIKGLPRITLFRTEQKISRISPRTTIKEVLDAFPKHIYERVDRALLNIAHLSKFSGDEVEINNNDIALLYPDSYDFKASFFILNMLMNEGYIYPISLGLPAKVTISPKGWSKIYELDKGNNKESNQGFCAMWFDPSMDSIWTNSISRAIDEAGFFPRRIDNKEHNGKICDEIIAEIRRSKFAICDFTGQRGGVYFEAGYAIGLGIPVIWTCREDWFKHSAEIEREVVRDGESITVIMTEHRNTHFDIDHYNFIIWRDEEELYSKLLNRIKATI